jgi:galactoside O-acetyltransferase
MSDYDIRENGAMVHRLANLHGDIQIGANSRIDAFVTLSGTVRLGANVHIATGACIFANSAPVTMGDNSGLSPGAKVFTGTTDPRLEGPLANPQRSECMTRLGAVTIGEGSVIGTNSVVLPGVKIGTNAMVGALSLVKQSIPDHEVWVGSPARFVRIREPL